MSSREAPNAKSAPLSDSVPEPPSDELDTICIVSTNVVRNDFTQQKSVSHVYHTQRDTCDNAPKPDSEHYGVMPIEYAEMAGKTLCKMCDTYRVCREAMEGVQRTVEDILQVDWKRLSKNLPDGYEVRILVHGINKTPIKVWSSYEE